MAKKKTAKKKKAAASVNGNGHGTLTTEQAVDRGIIPGDPPTRKGRKKTTGGRGEGLPLGSPIDGPETAFAGPYVVHVTIEGVAPLMYHAYNVDLIEWLDTLGKGAAEKKRDYPELMCFWDKPWLPVKNGKPPIKKDPKAYLCGHTDWFHRAIVEIGRRMTDPTSNRRSAKDLFAAGITVTGVDIDMAVAADLTYLMVPPTGGGSAKKKKYQKTKNWDYLDKRRVTVNNSAVPRCRPCIAPGWRLTYEVTVNTPSLIPLKVLREAIDMAGKLQGLGDFRPKFGRFTVCEWEVQDD